MLLENSDPERTVIISQVSIPCQVDQGVQRRKGISLSSPTFQTGNFRTQRESLCWENSQPLALWQKWIRAESSLPLSHFHLIRATFTSFADSRPQQGKSHRVLNSNTRSFYWRMSSDSCTHQLDLGQAKTLMSQSFEVPNPGIIPDFLKKILCTQAIRKSY